MMERIAEVIRKYQTLIDLEKDANNKKLMILALTGIKEEFNLLAETTKECPPELAVRLEKYLVFIEDIYNKRASN